MLSIDKKLVIETMPLCHSLRVYRVDGLRPSTWYQVKIFYLASVRYVPFTSERQNCSIVSITAVFVSVGRYRPTFPRLVDDPETTEGRSKKRRLLNTEKIIFKAEGIVTRFVLISHQTMSLICFSPMFSYGRQM